MGKDPPEGKPEKQRKHIGDIRRGVGWRSCGVEKLSVKGRALKDSVAGKNSPSFAAQRHLTLASHRRLQ